MPSPTFDQVFTYLSTAQLSYQDLIRLRQWHNALTGTPLAHLRKRECWLNYLQCVLDSLTERKAADTVNVHRTTSFRWRHRFIPAAAQARPARLSAIVEADET